MILECNTCPARGRRCEDCLVTALFAMPLVVPPGVGLPLDGAERGAVQAFVEAGLIDSRYAGSLRARGQPDGWWGQASG